MDLPAECKIALIRTLIQCEYPYRWQPRIELESVPDEMVRRLTEQLEEKLYDDEFQFEELMLYVGLAYEYAIGDLIEEGLTTLKLMKEGLTKKLNLSEDEVPESSITLALRHILMATKVDLLLRMEDYKKAVEECEKIPDIKDMNIANQAALYGLKAVFFSEYGIYGTKLALKFSTKAIEKDPDESLWLFLKGKLLGRVRHVERPFDVPQKEESELLEEALKVKNTCPTYLVFTAQLYRETANRIFRALKTNNSLFPDRQIVLDELNESSVELYNKSLELKPECSHMLFRCAKGFITFPIPFRDEKRAKECLDKALKKAPYSGYGNHVMAQYYERIKKEPQKAMKYLRVCEEKKVFGAVMDLLRLQYRIEGTDISEKLKSLLDIYPENSRKCQLYSQLVSYSLFANDLPNACLYTSEIIRLNPDSINMMQHRPITVNLFETINMYDVLVDDIKIQLQDSKCSKENKELFEKLLRDLSLAGIPVSLTKPTNLKDEIVNTRSMPHRSRAGVTNKSTNRGFKKNNDVSRYQQYQPKPRALHQTDTDRKMSEILDKCREDVENKKKQNFINQTVSTSYDRSKPSRKKLEESSPAVTDEVNGNRKTNRKIELETEKIGAQPPENDSSEEDSDDTAFRMKIYAKTQETLKEVASSKPSDPATSELNDIATSIQKIKLRDDSIKKEHDEYRNSKSRAEGCDSSKDLKSKHPSNNEQSRKKRISDDRDKEFCAREVPHNSDGDESNYVKHERRIPVSRKSQEKYAREKKGLGKFDTDSVKQCSNRSPEYTKRSESSSRRKERSNESDTENSDREIYYRRSHYHRERKYSDDNYSKRLSDRNNEKKSTRDREFSSKDDDRREKDMYRRESPKRSDRPRKESRSETDEEYLSVLVKKLSKKFEPKTLQF